MTSRPLSTRFALAVLVAALWAPRAAAQSFVNFESGHVRPLAMSPAGDFLAAVNTPDNRLAIYQIDGGGLTLAAEVSVGLEPVAVATRAISPTKFEAWVVNHLSDSVSIVEIDTTNVALARVTRTLLVGDEPRDIIFAGSSGNRAFITAAHRGQNRPGDPQLNTPGIGRADVWAFDATNLGAPLGGTPLSIITLFGDTPRALAKSPTTPTTSTVYAAVFHSGNRTTTITEALVCNGGAGAPPCGKACPAGPNRGAVCNNNSECPSSTCADRSPGGLPAPNTNDDGAAQPEVGLIVKFNGTNWVDELGRNWSNAVMFSLPDQDVFLINANANPPALKVAPNTVVGVGTVLFNMATRPNGTLFVSNTDALNEVRFEPVVNGHLAESRITVVNGTTPTAVHLNPHINYAVPGTPAEAAETLAFPTDMVFSSDGATLYVAGFGSGKVGIFDAAALEAGTVTRELLQVGGGPSGLALDEPRDRLYVMNRFDHTISVVKELTNPPREITSVSLRFDPSPPAARDGRRFLYDAAFTSSHGDSACASCHIFGDFDSLAWDLGDPFGTVVSNPNPFRIGVGSPFHPMKGPMTTQSLRGMSTNGPMHWRGDRTGGTTGGNPLDEDLAFKAFNPAFVGLLGRSAELLPAEMQAFTDFILTVQYPPNPIRRLDNDPTEHTTARDFFLNNPTDGGVLQCVFCHQLPLGADGLSSLEGETQEFKIAHLRNLYQKVGMFGLHGATKYLGNQVRGFGVLHDGSVPTVFNFISAPVFQNLTPTLRDALLAFLLSFDTGLAPAVGQQVSLTPATIGNSTVTDRIDLLIARANAGDCALVVKGIIDGVPRGALFVSGNKFKTDRDADAPFSKSAFQALAAVANQEQVYTCVPPGSGGRIGIDRDLDGYGDRTEIEANSDPADAGSVPGPVSIRTSALTLKDDTGPPSDPTRRKFSFKATTKDDAPMNRIVPGGRFGLGDPTSSGAGGGTLTVYNSNGSGEKVVVTLPAFKWEQSGTGPNGAPSYRFRGDDGDPISKIDVKENSIKIRGGDSAWAYSLDEAAQGRMAVRLSLGTASGWCADAPAKASGNPPSTARNDHVDKFTGQPKTAPPVTCPPVP